jgi:hydrogenase-1 operon protein HyaF
MSGETRHFPRPALAQALGREIAERLSELAAGGEPAVIDLRSLPMDDADRQALDALLGEGEVRATVQADGRSEVVETRFPGVWRVRHYDARDALRIETVEITPAPEILRADPADMRAAAAALVAATEEGERHGES